MDVRTDLVLEGGGAKGVALAAAIAELDALGYEFERIAGTSVGAIVGALLAAGMSPSDLDRKAQTLDLADIAPPNRWTRFGRWPRKLAVLFELGMHDHTRLRSWLRSQLADFGVETFGDLRIEDPEGDLPPDRRFRLVVTAADVTRGRSVRFPWDAREYGLEPDDMVVADAVAASAALPLAFEPVRLRTATGEQAVLVDGGLLSSFPIDVFDRRDGTVARWPTIGVKLSASPEPEQQFRVVNEISGPWSYVNALLSTAVASWDERHLRDPAIVERTVFVDTSDVSTLDFRLSDGVRQRLAARARESVRHWAERQSV